MKLWVSLYAMIWIVLIEFLLAMTPQAPDGLLYAHIVLGLGIIGLAYYNFDGVRKTGVPGRVKRVAKSSFDLSIVMAVLGLLLVAGIGRDWTILFGVTVWGLILLIHVVNAFAIITQAAAVAIAYDMWEDKEFVKDTAPGEVPAHPAAKVAALMPKS